MGPRRLGHSAIDKREIWSRWKAGQTLHEIGRVYGKCHNTIRAVLLPRGGISPVARRARVAATFRGGFFGVRQPGCRLCSGTRTRNHNAGAGLLPHSKPAILAACFPIHSASIALSHSETHSAYF